ncbi:hypothetical protein [Actinoplanes sp. NPDC023714]|uniref:hypothetical protein n=1 Tax=Actinoplanes sp. NPDC023714 TaxID=3154322 RepID=UPI0033C3AEB5
MSLAQDVHETVAGIQSGSWIDASLGGVGVSLEALSLVLDPLGSIMSWGVGWLLEHVAPLREALDQLAGDASAVATWENVAASLPASYPPPPSDWSGAAADAYRAHAASQADALDGIRLAAGGIASAVMGTGLLVSLVRELVRDLIADFVATLAARLPQWLAMEGLTLGVATPFVVSQVGALVASWARRIEHFVRGLLTSLRRLNGVLEALKRLLKNLIGPKPVEPGRMNSSPDPPPKGGGGGVPPPGPPWHARDDIAGPARGKELGLPHRRHTLAGAKSGVAKEHNTIILPGYEGAVRDDIRGIAAGEADWKETIKLYEINGRTYGVKPNGTVFPGTGDGLVRLDRNEYKALQQIALAKGDVEQVEMFKHAPMFVQNPEVIAKAKSIYDGTYSQ